MSHCSSFVSYYAFILYLKHLMLVAFSNFCVPLFSESQRLVAVFSYGGWLCLSGYISDHAACKVEVSFRDFSLIYRFYFPLLLASSWLFVFFVFFLAIIENLWVHFLYSMIDISSFELLVSFILYLKHLMLIALSNLCIPLFSDS